MIAATLQLGDFLWALDHSRRRYRVRETWRHETAFPTVRGLVTIVPLDGSRPVVVAERCALFPHEAIDCDRYALARLGAIEAAHMRRERER